MGHAQSASRFSVDQISPAPNSTAPAGRSAAGDPVRIAPVRGASSSASAREVVRQQAAPAVPPEIVEACQRARAEDRSPPQGVDCIAAMQGNAEAPTATAESSLLPLFGQPGSVTTPGVQQTVSSANADTVAQDLSNGTVLGNATAGAIARDRVDAPPPSSPR
jgi:hypothetical protein